MTLNFNCTVHVIIRVHQVPVHFAYYGEPKWNYMLLVHFEGSQFSQGIISIYRYLSFELCCRSRDHNYYVHCLLRLTLTYPTKRIRLTKQIWFYDYTCYSRFEACRSSSRVRSVQPPPQGKRRPNGNLDPMPRSFTSASVKNGGCSCCLDGTFAFQLCLFKYLRAPA